MKIYPSVLVTWMILAADNAWADALRGTNSNRISHDQNVVMVKMTVDSDRTATVVSGKSYGDASFTISVNGINGVNVVRSGNSGTISLEEGAKSIVVRGRGSRTNPKSPDGVTVDINGITVARSGSGGTISPEEGVIVSSDGVTVDINGITVVRSGSGGTISPEEGVKSIGIYYPGSRTNPNSGDWGEIAATGGVTVDINGVDVVRSGSDGTISLEEGVKSIGIHYPGSRTNPNSGDSGEIVASGGVAATIQGPLRPLKARADRAPNSP